MTAHPVTTQETRTMNLMSAAPTQTLLREPRREPAMRVALARHVHEGVGVEVWLDGSSRIATRAASCLVEPKAGDRLLLADTEERTFVLAILERGEPTSALEIRPEGDLRLRMERGGFEVHAREGVELVSGKSLKLMGINLDVRAATAELLCRTVQLVGDTAGIELTGVKVVTRFFDAIHERFTSRAKRSTRIVEETDVLRSEAIDYSSSKTVRVHGQNQVLTAEKLVKLNGDQVHLG